MRPTRAATIAGSLCVSLWLMGAVMAQQPVTRPAAAPATSDDLFQIAKVWTIHLTFSREAWNALTPIPSRQSEAPHTDGFRGPDGKRNGISALRGIDFQYVRASFDLNGHRIDNVGVRYKGN